MEGSRLKMEMRAFIMSGREEQLVLPLLRLYGLRGEWKVDFVDSRTRLGNAQTSLALHSLLPRFCGCAWNGGWCWVRRPF